MANENPVIRNVSYCLAHLPDLVRYGAKPRREIAKDSSVADILSKSLRSYSQAVGYRPNRVFLGNLTPEDLNNVERPWYAVGETDAGSSGEFGEIVSQDDFYAVLKQAGVLEPPLFEFTAEYDDADSSLPIFSGDELRGCFRRDDRAEGRDDASLSTVYLLENLCAKGSGALALKWLLKREGTGTDPNRKANCWSRMTCCIFSATNIRVKQDPTIQEVDRRTRIPDLRSSDETRRPPSARGCLHGVFRSS